MYCTCQALKGFHAEIKKKQACSKDYNFLEPDWSVNPPIIIGHLHVIGHLQSEIVILMINW